MSLLVAAPLLRAVARAFIASALVAGAAACSSTTVVQQSGDGGPTTDNNGSPDAASCGDNGGSGSQTSDSCKYKNEWSCGKDSYAIECECPKNSCTCSKNLTTTSSFTPPDQYCGDLSNCSKLNILRSQCGFPTPP